MAPVPESTIVTETVYVGQPCIVTTGETFAIWLNVLYLAPLIYLFVSFFIASYFKRSNAAQKADGEAHGRESNVALAEKAGWDAARDVEREVYGGENMVDSSGNGSGSGSAVAEGKRTPRSTRGRSEWLKTRSKVFNSCKISDMKARRVRRFPGDRRGLLA